MKFIETPLPGVFVIEPLRLDDARGYFARTWCRAQLSARGADANLAQCSISFNHRRGTLRGMHYQIAPHEETKVVRVTRGAIYDVALDLRPTSQTFKQWFGIELTAENHSALLIPPGCAHGFQTLADDTEVLYQISADYAEQASRGVRWNDPAFAIVWPLPVSMISERDQLHPDFS